MTQNLFYNIVLGLFSNLRGMERGALKAGFQTPFSTDISDLAKSVFNAEHPRGSLSEVFLQKDITNLKVEDIGIELAKIGLDLSSLEVACLVGGPPCFGISQQSANTRSAFHPLNKLMLEWVRMVSEVRPMTAWMEQVPALMDKPMESFRRLLFTHLNSLEGYSWDIKVLNAQNYGCFQARERTTLILVRDDLKVDPTFPKAKPVDLGIQSAFATIGAEKFRSTQFSHKPVDGRAKVFSTLTGSEYEIFSNGRWYKMTLDQRKIVAHMTEAALSGVCNTDLKKMLGMMVLPPFAFEIMKHIRSLLEQSGRFIIPPVSDVSILTQF